MCNLQTLTRPVEKFYLCRTAADTECTRQENKIDQERIMAKREHIEWLLEGVEKWNQRRKEEDFKPELVGVNIPEKMGKDRLAESAAAVIRKVLGGKSDDDVDLSGIDLSFADLRNAILTNVNLTDANLRCADLKQCDLSGAILNDADLDFADVRGTEFGLCAQLTRSQNFRWTTAFHGIRRLVNVRDRL